MSDEHGVPTCATCLHAYHDPGHDSQCRAEAPRYVPGVDNAAWPRVHPNDWCSKHPDRVIGIQMAMQRVIQENMSKAGEKPTIVMPRKRFS